jgi:hypothetical protein
MERNETKVDVLAVMEAAQVLAEHYSEPDLACDIADARARVKELVAAVQERRVMSAACGHSTGRFAESDARMDAALAALATSANLKEPQSP